MKPYVPKLKSTFIGREFEKNKILEFLKKTEAGILVVYGRRRVGKTELIQHTLHNRKLLKFEGVEGKDQEFQKRHFLRELAKYAGDSKIAYLRCDSWIEIFEVLAGYVSKGVWTLYFEELQWLAGYKEDFISELKYAWDNHFRYNEKLKLILCGSAPSYFHSKVLHSKALYNRSMMELPIDPFEIDTAQYFYNPANIKDMFDAYLTVGGIPLYLKEISGKDSVYGKIANSSFVPGGFFCDEFSRVFVSSYSKNPDYRAAMEIIGRNGLCSREQIVSGLNKSSGAGITKIIRELTLCGFVEEIKPLTLSGNSDIVRYKIKDYFLNYYFNFIDDKRDQILSKQFVKNPLAAISYDPYRAWLGYAFERFCRYNQHRIAEILGFSGVEYQAGALYHKRSLASGAQIDLAFKRRDKVLSICEIKYTDAPVSTKIIPEMERKIEALGINRGKWGIQRVLITSSGISEELKIRGYFDRVIDLAAFISD